jgi:hypothetical protein
MTTTFDRRTLDPRTRTLGVRTMLDEAHDVLPSAVLAELLLAVRRTLRDRTLIAGAGEPPANVTVLRPGVSQAARVYLRPIELMLHAGGSGTAPLGESDWASLDRYLDEVAARPRGAAAQPA